MILSEGFNQLSKPELSSKCSVQLGDDKKTDFYEPCEFTDGSKGVGGELTVRGAQLGVASGTNYPVTSASCSFGQFNKFDPHSTELTYGAVEILPMRASGTLIRLPGPVGMPITSFTLKRAVKSCQQSVNS